MSLTGKMGTKARICVVAAIAVVAALTLFCGKSKTKDAEVNSGDTSAVVVDDGDTSASTVDIAYDKYDDFKKALAVSDSERLDPKKYKNEKDYLKALDSARGARLDRRKAMFDKVKADFSKKIDFEQDLSALKMDDLLYLRSGIYAVNGLYFKEENLNSYFLGHNSSEIPWYSDYMCFLLEYAHQKKGAGFVENEKKVKLNDAEKRFVARIDKRISELRKDSMYVSKNGNTVGDVTHIVNMHKVSTHIYAGTAFMDKLTQNNFVIHEDDHNQLFHIYEKNDYARMPSFVTTDLFLQAFHMYLSYILKKLESERFLPSLQALCMGLYNKSMMFAKSEGGELAQIAEYNATFYAIAYTLFTGEELDVPEKYQKDYNTEIKYATEARADGVNSAFLARLAPQGEPMLMQYSLFKPRGYYTRKQELKSYFKGMMWLQKAFACRNREAHLKQSIFTAILLNADKTTRYNALIDVYASVFEPTAMLIGEPNNLSIMDIALFLQKENINDISSALSAENVEKVDEMLKSLAERIIIKPKVRETCADKINFMPQRYLIDNEVLQESVNLEKRPFPKGLDVFHAFGSTTAGDVLNNFYKEGEKWGDYSKKTAKLQKRFKNFDGWDKSTYNKWIESLLALQKRDKSYPAFMKTSAWDYKNLNTSLASWAELKHDFALYGEQPNAAEAGGDCDDFSLNLPEPDVEVGYVEPNILFWNKLNELITSTKYVLVKHGLLDAISKEITEPLQGEVSFLIDITKKELAKTPLNQEEYMRIKKIGGKIDHFTLNVLDPDINYGMWEYVTVPDTSIAVVADIYTGKNGILHVATGRANTIYVVVEINGYLYLTRGATFSYYEFVMPPGTRLTDEKWQAMEADNSKRPAIQEWMRSIISYGSHPTVYDDVHPIECFWRDGQCYGESWERDL